MDLQLLEDIGFRYRRIEALIDLAQTVLENCVDIRGIAGDTLDYSLYEIRCIIGENNEDLEKWIEVAFKKRRQEKQEV